MSKKDEDRPGPGQDDRPSPDADATAHIRPVSAPAGYHTDPHIYPELLPEPANRRLRQYAVMAAVAVFAVVCTVWLIWSYAGAQKESEHNAAAADKLCKQLLGLGQPCAAKPEAAEGVAKQAAVPAATAALTGSPLPSLGPGGVVPTDENGVAQAYQPTEGALIVAVGVQEGRLIVTFDDGARLDAGPVNEETLAIVLRQVVSPAPSASPEASEYEPTDDVPAQTAPAVSDSPEETP